MAYNYMDAMVNDISTYISNKFELSDYPDRVSLAAFLKKDLWLKSGITGNEIMPYVDFNCYAAQYIGDNWDLLCKALNKFDCYKSAIEAGPKYCDVTIRLYLLDKAIARTLRKMGIF